MKEAMPELPPIYEFANKIGMTFKQAELIRERDSMWQARLEEAVRAETFRCAALCDDIVAKWSAFHLVAPAAAKECAAAIRAKE